MITRHVYAVGANTAPSRRDKFVFGAEAVFNVVSSMACPAAVRFLRTLPRAQLTTHRLDSVDGPDAGTRAY
jgi:hypothetical protein